jgi:transcriptional regulator EpsA
MNAPERFFERPAAKVDAETLHGMNPIAYARFVAQATSVTTNEDFIHLARGALRDVFPHGMFLAGVGHAQADGIRVYHAIGIDYPRNYIQRLRQPVISAGPILAEWLRTREPQLRDATSADLPARWRTTMSQQNFRNVAAHGVRDFTGNGASYFTFSQIPGDLRPQHRTKLKALVPILHQALVSACGHGSMSRLNKQPTSPERLTERQAEILRWVARGKSNGEIAQILNLSEHTVKNHLKPILQKLGAANRTQAVKVFETMRGDQA